MRKNTNRTNKTPNNVGQIRIIAGQWRGRKLPVHDLQGLRPTTDRQKETLFNWLQGQTDGAQVLDLFAGAGGLGFEALSRYADGLVAVEMDAAAARQLKANAATLQATAQVVQGDALAFLQQTPTQSFDLVFVDPPFQRDLLAPTLALLSPWLAPQAWVYCESEAGLAMPQLPANWQLWRDKVAGQAHARLYLVESAD
ncbi:16S rRNA (guanine(966)-N(2))-methyltransferase RsmD [Neiella sp. HB171785]|uniref:Ribosomal RNA small subunit methyltransferase D n=1 Tax=Neiella litorisoli TaxID=2771431 RepID=A0A8J6QV99_9GAMM|nr:16S rRNA (guanine(966)-N(2))-methyltransferase RsmD [Neiella litorisoli]MBD1390193.1 16S rRNA (guanine(966)-N(2))-methyltransferase RsmD [Neiella litorisoli]